MLWVRAPMKACRIPYVEWVELGEAEREQIRREYWNEPESRCGSGNRRAAGHTEGEEEE